MAKITRYPGNLKAFASEALGTERTVFGDTTQSDALADNITTNFLRGWGVVGVNENPTKQDFNGLAFTLGQLLTYLHQSGVPEWDGEQEYHQNGMANRGGAIYVCKTDDHVSATPPESDSANWFKWLDENDVGLTNDLIATNAQRLRQAEVDMAGGTDVTLTESDSTADLINLTGTLTDDVALIVPDTERKYTIVNSTSGSFLVTVKTAAGAGVVVPQGQSRILRSDGTDVLDAALPEREWQDVGRSRSSDVTYTNTTGYEIEVLIREGGNSQNTFFINGDAVFTSSNNDVDVVFTVTVPNNSTYELSGSVGSWWELRS